MPEPIVYGEYIVADPRICHGKLTFRGTRIMVKTILEYVEMGEDWETISSYTDDKISVAAIKEAVALACRGFIAHIQEYNAEPYLDYMQKPSDEAIAV